MARALGADVFQLLHRGTHVVRALAELRDQLGERLKLNLVITSHCCRTPPMMSRAGCLDRKNSTTCYASGTPGPHSALGFRTAPPPEPLATVHQNSGPGFTVMRAGPAPSIAHHSPMPSPPC